MRDARLGHLLLDHVGGLLDGGDLLRTLLVESDLELLLKRHHDLDGVEGIGAEVDELGVGGDGIEVGAELLGDDGADLLEGVIGLSVREKRDARVSVWVPKVRGGENREDCARVLLSGTDNDGKPDGARVGCARPAGARLNRGMDMNDSPRRR